MTGLEHAILATALLAVFYYAGRYQTNKKDIETAIANTLDVLEQNNYIVCKTTESGDKELLEVIAKPKGL